MAMFKGIAMTGLLALFYNIMNIIIVSNENSYISRVSIFSLDKVTEVGYL